MLGYPITEKVSIGRALVQYFENSELIWHDSASGGYISLAPLGQVRLTELGLLPGSGPHPPGASPVGSIEISASPSPSATAPTMPSATATVTTMATATVMATTRPTARATRLPVSPTAVRAAPTRPAPTATLVPTATLRPSPSPQRTVAASGTDTPVAPVQ